MLSSAKHHRVSATNNNKTLNNKSPSISSPSPSSSSSSSSSSSQDSQTQKKRSLNTMEEVWKEINLSSIHQLNRHGPHPQQHDHDPRFRSHNQSQNPSSIFQDFLNGPLNQEPTSLTMAGASASNGVSTTASATVLSLSSGAGFEFLDNQDPLVTSNRHLSSNTPFEALVTSSCFGKKRVQEPNEVSGNRRHKRMIKNRESAARSRARKQAYTNELELEVAHLQAENARLKRQQEQLRMAAAIQPPKKTTLQRSSSAPF